MELVMSFDKNDKELFEALNKQFGDKIKYEYNKAFDGLEVLLTVVIPVTALTVQIMDFILVHFWDKDKELNDVNKKRVIMEPDGSIDLRGYTEEEARKIIECYFENQRTNEE